MRGPALRAGVAVIEQLYRGEQSFVVRDPVTHKYFRFRAAEGAVLRAFDGSRTIEEIAGLLTRSGLAISARTIQAFASTLSRLGLLEQSLAERTEYQLERLRIERRRKRSLFRGEWLRMRWSVGDANGWFDRAIPYLRWCFTRRFVAASLALFVVYGALLWARWPEFTAAVAGTFAPANLTLGSVVVLGSAFVGLTLIHELAHGFACKQHGGEVHELGFMLLYFTPAFYCNVNDAWSFPELKARLWVTAAGTWAELAVTSVAAIIWSLVAPDTLIAQFAVAAILIGGFTAVLTNANPLLPLDGYFALSDYLAIPNLRQRAAGHLGWWLRKNLLRLDMPEPESTPRERRIFLWYGALSALYIGLLLSWLALAVMGGVYRAIGFLGGALVVLAIVALVRTRILALWRGALLAVRIRAGGPRWRTWRRRGPLIVAAALVITALIPWHLGTSGTFTVQPVTSLAVTAPDSGVVVEVYPTEGSELETGAPVARVLDLESIRILAARNRISDSLAVLERLARATMTTGIDARLAAEQRAARAETEATRGRIAQMTIRARVGGTVVSDHPEYQVGRRVGAGDTVLVIQDLRMLEARVALGKAGSGRVRPGQRVRLIGYENDSAPVEGTVTSVSPAGTSGALEARVELQPQTGLRSGATGLASVIWARSTLLGAVWWAIRSRIRNDLLL
jgi:putative peptide zinc metalloprotease protein